ncbi:MAG: hypothetical protein K2H53_05125 [Clostridia bacterium]|nr:hypothetical protein [Clostridia bacterium]
MTKDTKNRQMDFDGIDLEQLSLNIISYSKFLIANDAYTISDTLETTEKLDSIIIEKNPTNLDNPPPKDIVTPHTQIYYIRSSDFFAEIERQLGTEALAF